MTVIATGTYILIGKPLRETTFYKDSCCKNSFIFYIEDIPDIDKVSKTSLNYKNPRGNSFESQRELSIVRVSSFLLISEFAVSVKSD